MKLHKSQEAMIERQSVAEAELIKHIENGEPVSIERAFAIVSAVLPCSPPTAKSYVMRIVEGRKIRLNANFLVLRDG